MVMMLMVVMVLMVMLLMVMLVNRFQMSLLPYQVLCWITSHGRTNFVVV